MSDKQAKYVADVIAKIRTSVATVYSQPAADHMAAILATLPARDLLNVYEGKQITLSVGTCTIAAGKPPIPMTAVIMGDLVKLTVTTPDGRACNLADVMRLGKDGVTIRQTATFAM